MYRLAAGGTLGAGLILVVMPDRWGVFSATILALACLALVRWNTRQEGKTFTIFPDGTWQVPGCQTPTALSASSVDLGGTLWLHGHCDDGRRRALMVLPDACESPQARRGLRVWFHHFAKTVDVDTSGIA